MELVLELTVFSFFGDLALPLVCDDLASDRGRLGFRSQWRKVVSVGGSVGLFGHQRTALLAQGK